MIAAIVVLITIHATGIVVAALLARWAGERVPRVALLGWFGLPGQLTALRAKGPKATQPATNLLFLRGVLALWGNAVMLGLHFALRARETKLRPTHALGAGAEGVARINSDPRLPPNAFWSGRREVPAVVRFANASREDDAALDARGATIRLCGDNGEPLLDLPMSTGEVCPFWDARSFAAYGRASVAGKPALEPLFASNARVRDAALAGLHRAPTSYTDLRYYTEIPLRWFADGVERYARYRLVPARAVPPDVVAANTLSSADKAAPWTHERSLGEKRRRNYLRDELATRLGAGPVTWRLEVQVHSPRPTDDASVFDPAVAWDLPWHNLASVELRTALAPERVEPLSFDLANAPESLGILLPWSPADANSVGWYRSVVYRVSQRMRGAAKG